MNKLNKRGDKLISVYWFAILFIVAGAIVYMAISFYGKPYDIRGVEADALISRISKCISESGYLREGVLGEEVENSFMEFCRLNFQVEDSYDWREQEQYYIKVNFINFDSKSSLFEIKKGNENLVGSCEIKGRNSPVCIERSFYSLDKEENKYKINVLSIVRKTEKNA